MSKIEKVFSRIARALILSVFLSAAWGASLTSGYAQPANDNFADAEPINGTDGSVFGDNFDATGEPNEPLHVGLPTFSSASVWYTWTSPIDGPISFDTVGSDFDTVLAVYTGSDLVTLQSIAGNDDYDPVVLGPSRVSFFATAGTVYQIAIDGFDFGFGGFGSQQGNIVLNWKRGFSAGTFQFAKENFIVSDFEDFPAVWDNMGPSSPSELGARITVTRNFGAVGKVYVGYQVDTAFYTNTYITNFYGTNIFITNSDSSGVLSFTNITSTNIASTNFYQNLVDGDLEASCGTPSGQIITITNENGNFSFFFTNFVGATLTNTGNCFPIPLISSTTTITTNASGGFVTNLIITNIFCNTFETNEVVPASPFFTGPVGGTLEFDDFEMSKTFFVKNIAFNYDFRSPANSALLLTITNVALDPLETAPIAPPGFNPSASTIEVKRFDMGAIPFIPERQSLPSSVPPCTDQGFIFNFERATFRAGEGGEHWFTVRRSGTNDAPCSVKFRVDYSHPFRHADHEFLGLLTAGSDIATPEDEHGQYPSVQPTDFLGDNDAPYLEGTLNWGQNDFELKTIVLETIDDSLVEFNEDLLVQLWDPSPQASYNLQTGEPIAGGVIGQIGRAIITIEFDDQPAGAIDRGFNADGSAGTDPYPNNPNPGANGVVFTTATQADGKSIIGGSFSAYNGIPISRIARMNLNGLLDSTFDPGGGPNATVTASAIQPDGKILIGGAFTAFDGIIRRSIARLNSNGSLDTTYKPQLGVNGTIWSIALQPDGKALIGGFFTSVNGTNRNHIARLNDDGSLDATFDPGIGANGNVFSVAVQPDGKILIGGEFTSVAGTNRNSIARLNAEGTLDDTFYPGSGTLDLESGEAGIVYSLALQPDGKVVLGGLFDFFSLQPRKSILRVNANGSLDTTFDPGTGADDTVYTVKLQPDGKVLIGGLFTSYNETRRIGLARLFNDGSLDTSFMDTAYNQFAGLINPYFTEFTGPTNNTRNYAFTMSLQSDGDIVIGGGFSHGGGGGSRDAVRPRQNVARLIGGVTPGPGNIGLTYTNYTATENGQRMYITLVRTNGNLGPAAATFGPASLPDGPGAAVAGVDFNFNGSQYGNPTWRSSWPARTWMQMDGLSGQNNATVNVFGNGLTYNPDLDDVFVDLLNNSIVDGNRRLNFELSRPNGTDIFYLGGENIPLGVALGRSEALGTIVDEDQPHGVITFSAPTYTVNESGGSVQLNIIRENGSVGPVTVKYNVAVTNGTATYNEDYTTNKANTVSFTEGETNKPVFIPIINDTFAEFDETIVVYLTIPTGGAILNTNATNTVVTIVDNDFSNGRLDFVSATFATNESKAFATVSVKRTHGTVGSVSVQCAATDGTATNNLDFAAVTNTLSWAAGDSSIKTLTVPILNDSLVEGNETVNLRLFNPIVIGVTNNTLLGQQSNAVLVIEEDDFYGDLRFSVPNFSVNENGGAATITVLRVGGLAEPITIRYSTLDGTALKDIHYGTNSGLLSFAPNQVTASFQVSIIDDFGITNNNRTVNLVLSDPSPTNVVFQANATLTIIDNESINEIAGSLDTSFINAAGANDYVYAIALQNDGKLVFGGDFTEMNHVPRNRIARLRPNGAFDATFSSIAPADGFNGSVRSIAIQTDGRMLVGGLFTTNNGIGRHYVSRLNFDGSTDSVFNPGAGANSPIYAVAETFVGPSDVPDNRRVLVAGSFTSFDGTQRSGIARLLNSGRVDGAFDIGSGVNGTNGAIHCMALQVDGKIIIGGDFTSFNDVFSPHIARLNVDGSVDLTFNPGVGPNDSVRAIAIQTDGKIVIGGIFTNVSGASFSHVARLNPNGTVDNTFTPGVGANDSVYAIALQVDGKILLGGEFTLASGVTRNRLTRLNADGTVDPTINFGEGANNFVTALQLQPDGKIILAGGFTQYDRVDRPHLARIHGGSMNGLGKLEFVSSEFEVNENVTNAVINVRRTGSTGLAGPVYVDASTVDGTAENGLDYVGVTNQLVFPVGETRATFTVPIINDDLVEESETVQLRLSAPTNGATPGEIGNQPEAILTIVNDDAAISFASASYRFAENEPNENAFIDIVRTGSTVGIASVNFVTLTNGSATPDLDFGVVTNVTVTFEDGETIKTALVPLINDNQIEGDETISLELSNVFGAVLSAPTTATLTVTDDDTGPGHLTFLEPVFMVNENETEAKITVIRTNGSAGFVGVSYSTAGGTATTGTDYAPTNGTISFGPGVISKDFFVRILDDFAAEGNETVQLLLSNPTGGATISGSNSVPLVIVDNEVTLSFSTPAYVVNESDGGVTLTVRRLSGTNGITTVFYESSDITATNNVDYIGKTNTASTTNTLVFADGETFKTFTIPVLEDNLVEGDESFAVRLFGPSSGAQLASPSNAVVTIVDNDSSFNFSAETYTVDESGTNIAITIVRTNTSVGTASVSFSTSNATATAGADYSTTNGTVTFLDGEIAQTILIPIVNDASVEGDETFTIHLKNPSSGAAIGVPSVATVTIVDNDAGLRFSSPTYLVNESGVSVTVTVLRTTVTNSTVSVNYTTANGTATENQDYVGSLGLLTFTNGETAKTFTVSIIDDTAIEGDETVLLTLLAPSPGSTIINPGAAVITIMDNDGSLIIPAGSALISESGPANNIIDPSENVTLYFAFRNTVGSSTANLVATLLPGTGVTSPSGPQNYGVLNVNGASVSRPFSFTASGTNGQQIMATFQLQDGSFDLGTGTFTYTLGTRAIGFTNSSVIVINDSSSPSTAASPYPSTIDVSGIVGTVSKVAVTISNLNHSFPDDIDMLLVSPAGQKILLMSDVGGATAIANRTITFDDFAGSFLPDGPTLSSGTFKPTDYNASVDLLFPVPAPAKPYSSTLSVLNGTNPNGTWSLYVVDDSQLNNGNISNGWSLAITASSALTPTADLSVTMSDLPDPAATNNPLTYTISITNHGPSTATAIVITNILPPGVTYVSDTCNCVLQTNNLLICPLSTLAKDAHIKFDIVVNPTLVGVITNTATVSATEFDPNLLNNTASAITTVDIPRADLSVSLTDSPDPVEINSNLTYSIVVSNIGPAIANAVFLTNTLPPGVAAAATNTVSNGMVIFGLGDIASGEVRFATLVVTPTNAIPGTITNIVTVGSSIVDPFKGNNTASVKTGIQLPSLDVRPDANGLVITWGTNAPGYTVYSTTNLSESAVWLPVTNQSVVVENGKNRLIINFSDGNRFFRLNPAP